MTAGNLSSIRTIPGERGEGVGGYEDDLKVGVVQLIVLSLNYVRHVHMYKYSAAPFEFPFPPPSYNSIARLDQIARANLNFLMFFRMTHSIEYSGKLNHFVEPFSRPFFLQHGSLPSLSFTLTFIKETL